MHLSLLQLVSDMDSGGYFGFLVGSVKLILEIWLLMWLERFPRFGVHVPSTEIVRSYMKKVVVSGVPPSLRNVF